MKLIKNHIESKNKVREKLNRKKNDGEEKRKRVKFKSSSRGTKVVFNVPNLGHVKHKGPNLVKKRFNEMVQRAAVIYNETLE